MVTVKDIDAFLNEVCPKDLSESWDNDGVMVLKDENKEIKKVLCTLDVTEKCIDYAMTNDYDIIISHHPFIFSPLKNLSGHDYRVIEKLIKSNISVLSYHTRFDSCRSGVNRVLADVLGLMEVSSFGGESGCIGKVGTLNDSLSANDFISLLKDKLGCGNIRASVVYGKSIKKVAVVGGAGKSFYYDAYKCGADAFVTSEVSHNIFAEAKELGISIFDCGHYYTENPAVTKFKELLCERFEGQLIVEVFDSSCPYENV